ncbi:MAG: NAD(P)/FAD-dependent oxidoreductase [Burkholderiales bacterium]|nr:NAD(P)/FAD-dependent oxidoreductase [Burkholderiales bacterium]
MDAVVIGAGTNEQACARLLARAGMKVAVLAGGPYLAGPGAARGSPPPRLARELGLRAHDIEPRRPDPWLTVPLDGGGRLELSRDMTRSVAAIRRLSARDAARWPEFCARMARIAGALEALYLDHPPDFTGGAAANLVALARHALRLRALGRVGLEDFLRVVPMPVADWLDDWFESDALKGALAAAGVAGLAHGPRAAGTALRLLESQLGNAPGVFRAPDSGLGDLAAATPGVDLRADAEVARIMVRGGRVTGVALAGGEEIAAAIVVSGAGPKRTLLELTDPAWLDPEFARAVRGIRARGAMALVTLAAESPPGWSRLVVAPSLDYLERASDCAKYGRVSDAPFIEAGAGERRADGRYAIHVRAQYTPCVLAQGEWEEERRRAVGEAAVRALSARAPELAGTVVERVLVPPDLEWHYGWPEGQEDEAEPLLDQWLWMRPLPELARYRTPIDGLYLCGRAMHPGGALPGAAGCLAARRIIRDGAARMRRARA